VIFARPLTWSEWILRVLGNEPWRIDSRQDPSAAPPIPGAAADAEREGRVQSGLFE
jgi:hypothetical protein